MRLQAFVIMILITSGVCTNVASKITSRNNFILDTVLNVKSFGATGDGTTDDYPAFRKVTDIANKFQHARIIIPKGIYYLNRYNDSNSEFDLRFMDCKKIIIEGSNAVINLKGDFRRAASIKKGRFFYSKSNQIVPFYFTNCSNISISGIEINGNVGKMTRDAGVVEKGQGLITFMGCNDILISNVLLHHSPSDGIYIGGTKYISTNVTIQHANCLNNARQGISITGLRNANIKSSNFSNTGFTGAYGYHRPTAGVDIEPVKTYNNVKTGNITFDSCRFENNIGGQFLCTKPNVTSNITIRNCIFKGVDSFSRYQVILNADSVLLDNSKLNLGKGNIFPTWKPSPGSVVTIQNCEILSSLNGILSASLDKSDTVILKNNYFKFTGDSLRSFFPYLQTANLYFSNNKIFIPSKVHRTNNISSLVSNAIMSNGNKFYSDNNQKLKVSYSGTKKIAD